MSMKVIFSSLACIYPGDDPYKPLEGPGDLWYLYREEEYDNEYDWYYDDDDEDDVSDEDEDDMTDEDVDTSASQDNEDKEDNEETIK